MKGIVVSLLVPLSAFSIATSGCALGCIEDASGTHCSAKSLDRYEGQPSQPQLFDRAPGAPLTIDVIYGNVQVARSGSGKVEVQFFPYVYAAYDAKASAQAQLAQNLRPVAAVAGGAVNVSVRREGGTNGLGADTVVRIPDNFDGLINVINHGDGPINDFDIRVEYVARASALQVTNRSMLGNCFVQGAPSVRSTTVKCDEEITVLDVADDVTIDNTEKSHDANKPAIRVRVASVAPNAKGGRVASASGPIAATFPRAAGYVVNASSPVKGVVQEGMLPSGCSQSGAPNHKTITCGHGPTYELVAGAAPDYVGPPPDSNVLLSYQ